MPMRSEGVSRYLKKMAESLFEEPESRNAFIEAITCPQTLSQAVVLLRDDGEPLDLSLEPRFSWQPPFVERITPGSRIGSSPHHVSGALYALDLSSVFEACVLDAIKVPPRTILDLCAAPGGKSIFAWRRFGPDILVCNEVIRKRVGALISNLKRCQISSVGVLGFDSKLLAKRYEAAFDLVIVDAPCSGQSLLARGVPSPGCFHPATINMNSNRQKRILANGAQCVAPGGSLAYMTCTYSRKENEEVITWFLKKFSSFEPCEVKLLSEFRSNYAQFPCYRMWPQDGSGAGGFTILLKRSEDGFKDRNALKDEHFIWSNFDAS